MVGQFVFKPLVTRATLLSLHPHLTPVVQPINEGPPTIERKNHNGPNLDRSLCLTIGAGEAAAAQCGDLLVTHALPAYRTMGRPALGAYDATSLALCTNRIGLPWQVTRVLLLELSSTVEGRVSRVLEFCTVSNGHAEAYSRIAELVWRHARLVERARGRVCASAAGQQFSSDGDDVWNDYRRGKGVEANQYRVGAFERPDTRYVVPLFPRNPQTCGGGAIVEVYSSDRAILLRILD